MNKNKKGQQNFIVYKKNAIRNYNNETNDKFVINICRRIRKGRLYTQLLEFDEITGAGHIMACHQNHL